MTVNRNHYIFRQGIVDFFYHINKYFYSCSFHCIRQINHSSAGFNYFFKRINNKLEIFHTISEVLNRKLHFSWFTHKWFCIRNSVYRRFPDFFRWFIQNIFHIKRTHCNKCVESWLFTNIYCLNCRFYITIHTSCKTAYNKMFRSNFCQSSASLKIHLRCSWESCLYSLYTKINKFVEDKFFFLKIPWLF